jgi:hypothetical protein
MATLATEPGRGRKHCPGCNKYPGAAKTGGKGEEEAG